MKKIITLLLSSALIFTILVGCSNNNSIETDSENVATQAPTTTPTEDPLKSGYYTDLSGIKSYVMVGKLSHIVINCTDRFVKWEYRNEVSNDEIQTYQVVVTPIQGDKNFSIQFDKSELGQVTKFTAPIAGYFRVYLNGDPYDNIACRLLKGPEWINENSNNTTETSKTTSGNSNVPATDFEITGGSSNVYLISKKNYGVICPYCGYKSGAMGTSNILLSLNEHYAGEVAHESQGFICASSYQGGCRQTSTYSLEIEYK